MAPTIERGEKQDRGKARRVSIEGTVVRSCGEGIFQKSDFVNVDDEVRQEKHTVLYPTIIAWGSLVK